MKTYEQENNYLVLLFCLVLFVTFSVKMCSVADYDLKCPSTLLNQRQLRVKGAVKSVEEGKSHFLAQVLPKSNFPDYTLARYHSHCHFFVFDS